MSTTQRGADILLVASHAPDLAGMRAVLGERLSQPVGALKVTAKVVGVGMSVAGASTARGILGVGPRAVLHVGTCGVYPGLSQYRPHDVIVPASVKLLDHAVLAGRAAFPEPMQTSVEYAPLLGAALATAYPRVARPVIASTLATTTDDAMAAAVFGATGCEAENLEAFAIASACRAADVPFAAVLGVTNIVGSTGRQDWAQFQREAVNAAATAVTNWLHAGCPGLPHGVPFPAGS